MATTVERSRDARPVGRPPVQAPARRGVRVPELVLGVLLVFGFGLAAVVWHTSTTSRTDVLVLARDVRQGEVLAADDLRAVAMSADEGVRLVPFERREAYVGQVVRTDLAAGTPLARALVQDEPALADGEGLASVKLAAGDAPTLAPGDTVDAVQVPQEGMAATAPSTAVSVVAQRAVVWAVEPVADNETSTVVTLRLPLADARAVSAAASDLRLVRVG
jgi:Flp pilus assembly protein CpaB